MQGSNNPLAVIELGTTSIRMVVAQVNRSGKIHLLDELQQAVSLGRDALLSGRISLETTESCVSGLNSFSRVLQEYGIGKSPQLRVVATSAIRESANRAAFVDRMLIATGFDVEVIDQAEVNRLTYRAVRPQLKKQPFFRKSDVLVIEVGGGSTETLLFRKGKVSASHMYRMGSLRLRTLTEDAGVSAARARSMMRGDIAQTVAQILHASAAAPSLMLMLLGADARFAAAQLRPSWDRQSICRLRVAELRKFITQILGKTVDDMAEQYNMNYPEAETLGPALLIYLTLLEELKTRTVLVGEATLRNGILMEMATGEQWTAEFKRQVINSALAIARRYGIDLRHARNVAAYSLQILHALKKPYDMSERDEVVLHVAALLHEVGLAVNASSHHKHSRYLILNSDIFGLRRRDIELAALVARYHRRAAPRPSHTDYMALPRDDRITVCKLAAILRVANGLDRARTRRPMKLETAIEEESVVIAAETDGDLDLVQRRVKERAQLFRSVFGKKVSVTTRAKQASR